MRFKMFFKMSLLSMVKEFKNSLMSERVLFLKF